MDEEDQLRLIELTAARWSTLNANEREEGVANGREEGRAMCTSNMAEAPSIPRHVQKRRRLSQLLDRLSLQLRNNNIYPLPPWLNVSNQETPSNQEMPDELPLDLSVRSDRSETETTRIYGCGACGATFSVHDRLMKHVASRHRNKVPEAGRAYECGICKRKFGRSDMLTRHARLHSGVKPYSCSECGQLFSRSDHLATHLRTHTGEKPYRCSACPYAACRRDMITRHMRTHMRRPQPA